MIFMNLNDNPECNLDKNLAGILVLGGDDDIGRNSVEIWSAVNPEQGSCVLNDYPRSLEHGPTVNLVSGRLVTCYWDTCEIYEEGSWRHLTNTTYDRQLHTSAATKDAVLLIGGDGPQSPIFSTEWIPVDGSPAQQGPFTVRHGNDHCTIQTSESVIVLTGGDFADSFVTPYHLLDGSERPLTPLIQGRRDHACGVYQDANGQQVSKGVCGCRNAKCLRL